MHHIDLSTITLTAGAHWDRDEGLCVMEAVAWWANEKHSDHPRCVDPLIAEYARHLNDKMLGDVRQRLVPYIPRLVGTANDGIRPKVRAYICADRAVRTFAPISLRARGWATEAETLEALTPVVDRKTALLARETIQAISHVRHWPTSVMDAAAYAVTYAARCGIGVTGRTSPTLTAAYAACTAVCAAADDTRVWDHALRLLDDLIVGRRRRRRRAVGEESSSE